MGIAVLTKVRLKLNINFVRHIFTLHCTCNNTSRKSHHDRKSASYANLRELFMSVLTIHTPKVFDRVPCNAILLSMMARKMGIPEYP